MHKRMLPRNAIGEKRELPQAFIKR
jgi:hypothetical protein